MLRRWFPVGSRLQTRFTFAKPEFCSCTSPLESAAKGTALSITCRLASHCSGPEHRLDIPLNFAEVFDSLDYAKNMRGLGGTKHLRMKK